MNFAVQKTIELVLVIGLGLLLQKKIGAKENLKGVKVLILSVALPATIFIALLKIKLESSLLVFPLIALGFNIIMFVAVKYLIGPLLQESDNRKARTLNMLLPSLAPGLSCFPFILVYAGDDTLAMAAISDVGNKVFVLIILYIIALRWYHSNAEQEVKASPKSKLASLFMALINEPINIIIIIAMILLGFGLNLDSLPGFIGNTFLRISAIMTPLVLLFIGMSARIKWSEFRFITSLLCWRAGIAFLLSGILIFFMPSLSPTLMLLAIVFPQSSCSFWPFAHMSSVQALEEQNNREKNTFDIDFAISLLACSLPFSCFTIMGVFTFSDFFINPGVLFGSGAVLFSVPLLIRVVKVSRKKQQQFT